MSHWIVGELEAWQTVAQVPAGYWFVSPHCSTSFLTRPARKIWMFPRRVAASHRARGVINVLDQFWPIVLSYTVEWVFRMRQGMDWRGS